MKIVAGFNNLRLKMIELQFQHDSTVNEGMGTQEKVALIQQIMATLIFIKEKERNLLLDIYELLKTYFSDGSNMITKDGIRNG